MAQYVHLRGKDFYVGNEKFYPMVINYNLWAVTKYGNYFLAPDASYNTTYYKYECDGVPTCTYQMQVQFDYIVGMGFNTVRIAGFCPTYIPNTGLVVDFKNYYGGPEIRLFLNPSDPVDPGMLAVKAMYDKVLDVANAASLKVIFIMTRSSKKEGEMTDIKVDAWADYLAALASHFKNSNNGNALLAYDLINEPAYNIEPLPTKQRACEIISTWYDSIKKNDPHHLVTIGNCGYSDIFSFDPSILKVDFNSIHYYPHFKPFEDKTNPGIQELARIRTANELYWFNQSSIVPWIVGETSFSASEYWDAVQYNLHGMLTDQEAYAAFSLDAACNCGASGYSWWQYKDKLGGNPASTTFRSTFYGILARWGDGQPGGYDPFIEKPAVNIFRNYIPGATGAPCPVDYSPIFDASKVYYNPYRYEYPADTTKVIKRRVVDKQTREPIKDAVVRVKVSMGRIDPPIITPSNDTIKYFPDEFYTHTDANGYFEAIPAQFNSLSDTIQLPDEFPGIRHIIISAAGASVYDSGWRSDLETHIPNPIELNRINFDVVVKNETVSSGQNKTYKGRKSLTVSNTNVNIGGRATFTSQKSITLLPDFTANAGSHVYMYIAHSGCDELTSFQTPRNDSPVFAKSESEMKEIELLFEKNVLESSISIFPNPANSSVTIQLHSKNQETSLNYIKFYDVFGRIVLSKQISGHFYVIDVSRYPKGIYFIEAKDETTTYYQKIIVQ
jgi:hypothetical protein